MSEENINLIIYRLDELKKDTQEIKEHAKYTNGKVAEVLNWKLQNEEFVECMKKDEVKIKNSLQNYEDRMNTKKSIWNNTLVQLSSMAIVGVISVLTTFFLADKIIK